MSEEAKRFCRDVIAHVAAYLIVIGLIFAGGYIGKLLAGLIVPAAKYAGAAILGVLLPVVSVYSLWAPIERLRWPHLRVIRGDWQTSFVKAVGGGTEIATVKQLGPSVWGIISYAEKRKIYRFRGKLYQSVLVATYWWRERRGALDVGAFTLLVSPDGDRMKGKYSWTDSDNLQPQSGDYEWILKAPTA